MERILKISLNDEQIENFENVLEEAKNMLPDDEEEFQEAHEDSYVGTIRTLLEQIAAQKTNTCEV